FDDALHVAHVAHVPELGLERRLHQARHGTGKPAIESWIAELGHGFGQRQVIHEAVDHAPYLTVVIRANVVEILHSKVAPVPRKGRTSTPFYRKRHPN